MAAELPGELLGKSGNRGASLDADLRLRERRAASARSSTCHPGHQSNAGPANDSLFHLSCGLKEQQRERDLRREGFRKGENTELERGFCVEKFVEGP